MGFLDNVKNKVDNINKNYEKQRSEYKQKVAATKSAQGDKLDSLAVEYMGGYGEHKKAKGGLIFYQRRTEFKSSLLTKFMISNTEIRDVAIEGKDEVNRRVTVTRLLAVGIFAFALKKKSRDKDAFITLVLADGQEVIFHVEDKSPMELKAKLAKAISAVKHAGFTPTVSVGAAQTIATDELTKLAKLKEQGIITQEDFDKKKSQLLGL